MSGASTRARPVFRDLGRWMTGLGLAMGIVFPFFVIPLGVPSRTALAPGFFAATVAAGLAVGAMNWWLSRRVIGRRLSLLAERLRTTATEVQQAAAADHPLRLARPPLPGGDDELAVLARAFDSLLTSLEQVDLRLRAAHALDAEHRALAATVADELADNERLRRDLAQELAAQRALEAELRSAAGDLRTAVGGLDGLSDVARTASARAGAVADAVRCALDVQAGHYAQIGRSVDAIASIAARTDLLALNASVEAARAGAAGQAFRVVADAVKGLARNAAEATTTARAMVLLVEDDQESVRRAVEGIGAVVAEVDSVRVAIERARRSTA